MRTLVLLVIEEQGVGKAACSRMIATEGHCTVKCSSQDEALALCCDRPLRFDGIVLVLGRKPELELVLVRKLRAVPTLISMPIVGVADDASGLAHLTRLGSGVDTGVLSSEGGAGIVEAMRRVLANRGMLVAANEHSSHLLT